LLKGLHSKPAAPTEEIMAHECDTWVPKPRTGNDFNGDVVVPTSEVVEPPAQVEYAGGYGQVDYEQPTSQILPIQENVTYEYGTWPGDNWVPMPHRQNEFPEDVIETVTEVVEPPAELDYAMDYGQMHYEQPMSQFLMAGEVFTYDYGTRTSGNWVPTLQRENPFFADSARQMPISYLQYPPQLEWMNTYQW
jgi:hypothetical protein